MTCQSLNLTQVHGVLALLYTCCCNSKLMLKIWKEHTRRESQRRVSVTKMLSRVGLRWKANRMLTHWRSWSIWRETSASRWCANSAVHTYITSISTTYYTDMYGFHLVVQWLSVGLVIERSQVQFPAWALLSQLGQLSLPSLQGR